MWHPGACERGRPRAAPIELENEMSKNVLCACLLVLTVAACAKKSEPVYVEQPVSQEPVFTGKYK